MMFVADTIYAFAVLFVAIFLAVLLMVFLKRLIDVEQRLMGEAKGEDVYVDNRPANDED